MPNRRINFYTEKALSLAAFISSNCRFPSSSHHLKVRKFIKNFLDGLGLEVKTQKFKTQLRKPLEGKIERAFETIEGVPYTNSPSAEIKKTFTVDCRFGLYNDVRSVDLEDKIAIVREGKKPFRKKEELLKAKGAVGVIVYKEDVDLIFNGISAGLLPVFSIRRSDYVKVLNEEINLTVITRPIEVEGENIWVEFGNRGPYVNLIAHYDSKPFTEGAIDNATGVSSLLALALRLSQIPFNAPYRLRLLFTDLEEYGLLGARVFVNSLEENEIKSSIAVSVDTIGWHNPAVLSSDGEGQNDPHLLEVIHKILKDLGLREKFNFIPGRSGRSDHIPFRNKGAKTLFLGSNPFPIRHTEADSYEEINPLILDDWMGVLTIFATQLHRYF